MNTTNEIKRNRHNIAYVLPIALGVVSFLAMGLYKVFTRNMDDFQVLFAGAASFAQSLNPYLRADMLSSVDMLATDVIGMQLTLPGLFLLLRPIANLPLQTAEIIWTAINLIAIASTITLLAKLAKLPVTSIWFSLFLGYSLLLGPTHTALWLGNTDILALFFVVLALFFMDIKEQPAFAALALGMGMVLKIHSAGLFAFYFFCRGKFLSFIISMCIWVGFNVAAAFMIQNDAPSWLSTWRTTVKSEENIYNKVSSANLDIEQLIHLTTGVFGLTGNAELSGVIAILFCITIFVWFLIVVWSNRNKLACVDKRLTDYSIVVLVSLLIVYHKFYGAVFLTIPLACAISLLRTKKTKLVGLGVLGLFTFTFLNGQIIYKLLLDNNLIPMQIANSLLGQGILQFHLVWIQLIMLIIFIRMKQIYR